MPSIRLEIIKKQKQDEWKEEMIQKAFFAHQLGAGGDKTFGDYLFYLGLGDRPEGKPRETRLTAQEIKDKARQTLARARELRKKKHV